MISTSASARLSPGRGKGDRLIFPGRIKRKKRRAPREEVSLRRGALTVEGGVAPQGGAAVGLERELGRLSQGLLVPRRSKREEAKRPRKRRVALRRLEGLREERCAGQVGSWGAPPVPSGKKKAFDGEGQRPKKEVPEETGGARAPWWSGRGGGRRAWPACGAPFLGRTEGRKGARKGERARG